jgi:molecular chaperone DnaK (HSP70)
MTGNSGWNSTSGQRNPVMPENRYVIGIDLGTTNSAVSYVDLAEEAPKHAFEIFPIPQLTGPGEISALKILPSFLYIPGQHEIPKNAITLGWDSKSPGFAGAFARDQGAAVPDRLVSSAKSWLCHARVNRKAPILPWAAGDEVPRVSPVEAASAYLRLIKTVWNRAKGEDEDQYIERQRVIITVPASFDEAARDLTVEAASQAGLKNITLLEEPLAAFYSWLIAHDQDWDQHVKPGEMILVCDVGGGTTDFTLISLREKFGAPAFERIAVGDHLILGGDNMDLTLARYAEQKLKTGKKGAVNIRRWQALCNQCRQAKETILSGEADTKAITLVGEGRQLIAGALSTTLSKQEMEDIILDGFFPLVEPDDDLQETPRRGMTEFGLPYAQDPAITRHLIRFLKRHADDIQKILGRQSIKPDLILFNGAALKPAVIQAKIRASIRHWFKEDDSALPVVLANADLELAVALGASYYGLVKEGVGIRVGSGSARSYFLGVGGGTQSHAAGANGPDKAVCVVERGTEEGHQIELVDKEFQVLTNQPVSFDLYSSSFRAQDRVGDVVDIDDSLTPLPPIHTVIQYGKKGKQTTIPVKVEAAYTEVGTLALWCRSTISDHKWRLQFQLRSAEQAVTVSDQQVLEQSLVDEAYQKIAEAFSDPTGQTRPAHLIKTLSQIIGIKKEDWPLNFIRLLADHLTRFQNTRERSPEHEGRWYNLLGFFMRPGFGDAADEHRLKDLWKIFDKGPIHSKNTQVCSEWWVLWRRVAGGLSAKQQRYMSQKISGMLRPKKSIAKIRLAPQEELEIWMALANLERLSAQDKTDWGRLLLDQLKAKKAKPQYWWALSRLGARELLYGPVDCVVSASEAASWIDAILVTNWRNPKPAGEALSQLARLTADLKRDVAPEILEKCIAWLKSYEWSEPCLARLKEVIPIAPQEQSVLFGESVPSGIVLRMDAA